VIHWLSAVGSCHHCAFRNHLLPSFANLATFRSSLLFVFIFFLPSGPFSLESLRPSSYTDGLLLESFHSQRAHSLSLLAYDSADARHTVTLVSVSRCLSPSHSMSSSIAIPVGPSATPSCHKGTGSSANSPYSTSPSCSPSSAGKDKALHARRPSLLSWLKPDPPPTRRDCTHRSFVPALLTLSQAPFSQSKNAPSLTSANRTALLGW
jgi:hypothetical protein